MGRFTRPYRPQRRYGDDFCRPPSGSQQATRRRPSNMDRHTRIRSRIVRTGFRKARSRETGRAPRRAEAMAMPIAASARPRRSTNRSKASGAAPSAIRSQIPVVAAPRVGHTATGHRREQQRSTTSLAAPPGYRAQRRGCRPQASEWVYHARSTEYIVCRTSASRPASGFPAIEAAHGGSNSSRRALADGDIVMRERSLAGAILMHIAHHR